MLVQISKNGQMHTFSQISFLLNLSYDNIHFVSGLIYFKNDYGKHFSPIKKLYFCIVRLLMCRHQVHMNKKKKKG